MPTTQARLCALQDKSLALLPSNERPQEGDNAQQGWLGIPTAEGFGGRSCRITPPRYTGSLLPSTTLPHATQGSFSWGENGRGVP